MCLEGKEFQIKLREMNRNFSGRDYQDEYNKLLEEARARTKSVVDELVSQEQSRLDKIRTGPGRAAIENAQMRTDYIKTLHKSSRVATDWEHARTRAIEDRKKRLHEEEKRLNDLYAARQITKNERDTQLGEFEVCLLYTSPSPRD